MAKIIRHLGSEVAPLIEIIEQPFYDRTEELLKDGKVIAACNDSVENGMGAHWVMMTKWKEELTSHEMHAKDWNLNYSKKVEALTPLDLIATLE